MIEIRFAVVADTTTEESCTNDCVCRGWILQKESISQQLHKTLDVYRFLAGFRPEIPWDMQIITVPTVPNSVIIFQSVFLFCEAFQSKSRDVTSSDAGRPIEALVRSWLVMDHPHGAAGTQQMSATQSGYTCSAQGALGASISNTTCRVTLPRARTNQVNKDTYDVNVTLDSLTANTTISVFRPEYRLSIADDTLRQLSPQNCSTPVYEAAKVAATAEFLQPDDESKRLQVDLTSVAELKVNPPASAQLQNGVLNPTAAVVNATVAIGAAAPNSPLTTARFTVLDETTCIDELVPVVTSTARLGILESAPGLVTVQLEVQQKFADPGDEGVVAVYAQRVSGDNTLLSTDVTGLVRCSPFCASIELNRTWRRLCIPLPFAHFCFLVSSIKKHDLIWR